MKRGTVPTCTSVVLAFLVRLDSFATAPQIRTQTGLNVNQVSAALHHLRNRRAVNCMEDGGHLWWYATPQEDNRTFVLDERVPESKPRNRKPRKSDGKVN